MSTVLRGAGLRGAGLAGLALLIISCCSAAVLPRSAPYENRFAVSSARSAPEAVQDLPSGTVFEKLSTVEAADATRALPDVPVFSTAPSDQVLREPAPPVRVRIDVGIDMPVVPVGVRDDGLMQIPDDVGVAGWYRWGPDLASGSGATVIAAHVDSLDYGIGPFAKLKDLPLGSTITVVDAAGQDHAFTVADIQSTPKQELPVAEVFARDGPARLVLITCGGTFDENQLTYSDNVILTAIPSANGG